MGSYTRLCCARRQVANRGFGLITPIGQRAGDADTGKDKLLTITGIEHHMIGAAHINSPPLSGCSMISGAR